MTRKVLGRGLSALIPIREPEQVGDFRQAQSVRSVPIEEIVPASEQPRKRFDEAALGALIESIRQDGVLQPLLVRERGAESEGEGRYLLIAGERRWRAAQRAGLKEVPVLLKEATEREAFELALVENLQREDLNPMEEAEAFERLVGEYGLTQEQVATRVGKERSTVANALRLLKLPPGARRLVEGGQLSMGQARALLGLSDLAAMERVALTVARDGLSARQVEKLVARHKSSADGRTLAPRHARAPLSANVRDLQARLERALGTRVKLIDENGRGRIEIAWSSLDELDRLLGKFLGN